MSWDISQLYELTELGSGRPVTGTQVSLVVKGVLLLMRNKSSGAGA